MARTRSVLAGALLASLALTGCTGGDDPKPTSSSNASASRTSTPGNGSKATVNKLGKEWKSADKKVTYTVDKVDVKTSKGGVGAFVTACAGKEDAKVSTAGWTLVDERGVWVAAANVRGVKKIEPAFPAKATVKAGKCVKGWMMFPAPKRFGKPAEVNFASSRWMI